MFGNRRCDLKCINLVKWLTIRYRVVLLGATTIWGINEATVLFPTAFDKGKYPLIEKARARERRRATETHDLKAHKKASKS